MNIHHKKQQLGSIRAREIISFSIKSPVGLCLVIVVVSYILNVVYTIGWNSLQWPFHDVKLV